MASQQRAALANQLRQGWIVVGFSSSIMSADTISHSILLQRDDKLEILVTVVTNSGHELSRTTVSLAA